MSLIRISGTPLAEKVSEIYKEFDEGSNIADQSLRDVTASINLVFSFQWGSLCHAH